MKKEEEDLLIKVVSLITEFFPELENISSDCRFTSRYPYVPAPLCRRSPSCGLVLI